MDWAPQAVPQSPEEAFLEPPCPEVVSAAEERGIASIVHFTPISGLKGILQTSAIRTRRDLPHDERVKYVYEPNAEDRSWDEPWHGYVHLSVTERNSYLLRSSQGWHPAAEWVILEFDPQILGDPGVVFCTTNNIYPSVRRASGLQGFQQMFAQTVRGRYGSIIARSGRADNQTTDPQAEVLYPHELGLDHLHTITVPNEDTYYSVIGILSHFPSLDPNVETEPEAFQ